MDKEQRHVAKAQLVAGMQTGHSWHTAAAQARLPISQSNAYRLWRAFRQRGETALSDGRRLRLRVQGASLPALDAQERAVA
jgi:transposase